MDKNGCSMVPGDDTYERFTRLFRSGQGNRTCQELLAENGKAYFLIPDDLRYQIERWLTQPDMPVILRTAI
jgi:hypothetical protein